MCAACQSCHNSWKLFHDCVCCTTLTFMELLQSTCLVVHWDSGSFNLFLNLLTCLFKHQTSMESRQTTPNSSETTGLIFWCVVLFFSSREGVVGFLPLFGAAFTHPYFTLFTHPNALVSMQISRKPISG